ncbi:probable galactinol--sucrose galactosyltransferase 2 [Olea europaea subsp. europaea]|uniref:Probable galactinol--sucrose galactosyltransferase 2 n=1 Tax=Olea europaea subsp. europaea TaxID=158383 RepID=A0A8S0SZP3_OLEEU|nr:probable galactinol--sucrose galactosyltransferase 2 [Olea europaea subsp. europaea]
MGTCGKDIPLETQFMLVESKDTTGGERENVPTIYIVFLPFPEGQFHAVLQGNEKNELEICVGKAGDIAVETNQGFNLVYMHAGTSPFEVINQAVNEVKEDPNCVVQEGAQFANRLTGIKENEKFQKNGKFVDHGLGLKRVVEEAKQHHNVKNGYVWHALAGYWGGVHLVGLGMEHYDAALAYPVSSPGVLGNQPDIVMDSLAVHGLCLVHPKKVFNFHELHAYLASCGVDGVKVDVQNIIQTLGAGHGALVSLTRSYPQALEASVARNFPDNGCISCMCHNTDGINRAKRLL